VAHVLERLHDQGSGGNTGEPAGGAVFGIALAAQGDEGGEGQGRTEVHM